MSASTHEKAGWVHSSLRKHEIIESIRPLKNLTDEERKIIIEQTEGMLVVRDPLDRLVSAWRDKLGNESIVKNKTSFLVSRLKHPPLQKENC